MPNIVHIVHRRRIVCLQVKIINLNLNNLFSTIKQYKTQSINEYRKHGTTTNDNPAVLDCTMTLCSEIHF